MGAEAAALAIEVERAVAAALAAATAIDAAGWRRPTSGGWTVGVVFNHIAEDYVAAGHLIVQIAAGAQPATQTRAELDAANAASARLAAHVTKEDVLQRLQQNGALIAGIVQNLDDDSLANAAPVLIGGAPLGLRQIIERLVLGHITEHLGSVREALEAG